MDAGRCAREHELSDDEGSAPQLAAAEFRIRAAGDRDDARVLLPGGRRDFVNRD